MENTEIVKDFSDLLGVGSFTRDVVVKGHTIKLRTLSYDEQASISDNIPADVKEFKKIDMLQKELLSSSIDTIDGVKLTKDQKRVLLGNGQAAFCNMLFSEYEKLVEEQSKLMEEVKKNSSPVTKAIP